MYVLVGGNYVDVDVVCCVRFFVGIGVEVDGVELVIFFGMFVIVKL